MEKQYNYYFIGREFGSADARSVIRLQRISASNYTIRKNAWQSGKRKWHSVKNYLAHDEKPTNSFLYSLGYGYIFPGIFRRNYTDMPINHKSISGTA